eukprot:CAMPEP_0185848168 /NCGR_PEP_ID=MMETSP1354-20130828/3152_1 /TAXON_ID=708628 /ORGANISM="Erythrolobus madagascarensis, Strain CCMP3276" /LENGTH=238 /DNA_ID=CAMNT_0028548533 /DNA_START=118 /DNA_END=834 /DNA_ORIENTATION=-
MAAFVGVASARKSLGSLAGGDGAVASCNKTSSVVPRRAQRVMSPAMQYNYNIYQDGDERAKRSLSTTDRAVTLQKPLGLVLEEGQDGMVFIASIEENGSASKEPNIFVGDIVVAVSATFGDEVWSVRGVGLERVMKSIRVRAGDLVTLVLESSDQLSEQKAKAVQFAGSRREEARDKFGEREVLNPVTWTSQQSVDDRALQEQIEADRGAEEEGQDWILLASAGIGIGVILLIVLLSR